jgi:YebC/PmpR family DNA-binding regulatory protein
MSGHSKWETIKRKKGATDAKRAKEFTKIARLITVAAQNGGGDPGMNPSLALAIEKARAANMPNDNVERAIKKGTGEGGNGARIEEISYEGYAPGNVAMIIDCTTDNKNRTVGDVRSTFEKHGGRWAEPGAISWQFTTIGRLLMEYETPEEKKTRENAKWNDKLDKPKIARENADEFQLELMDLPGILDIVVEAEGIEITCEYAELNNVRKFIDQKGYKIADAGLVKQSNTPIELSADDAARIEEFIEKIEDIDDVQQVWTNVK